MSALPGLDRVDGTEITKLNEFLTETQAAWEGGEEVACVVGNESADLDSVLSAVSYGYATSRAPVIGVSHADLELRTEVTAVLAALGIPLTLLLTTDDLIAHPNRVSSLVLVDHNALPHTLSPLADSVVSIIDHHADERVHPNAARRIEVCGSCASLIAHVLTTTASESDDDGTLAPVVAWMLACAVVVDTINFSPDAGKAREADVRALEIVRGVLGEIDVDALYHALHTAKFDVSSLSPMQLLRRDAKAYVTQGVAYAIPGVFVTTSEFVRRAGGPAGVVDVLDQYAEATGSAFVVVMFTVHSPSISRQVVIHAPPGPNARSLIDDLSVFLQTAEDRVLDLQPPTDQGEGGSGESGEGFGGEEELRYVHFVQNNIKATRKKMAPLLVSFVSQQ